MRLTTKPGSSAQVIGCLRIACAKFTAARDGLGVGVVAEDDLEQRHDRRRVEEVEADDLLGPARRARRSRVIDSDEVFEARIAWPGVTRVELGEDRLLDLHPLGHGLDDEVDVAEAVVGRSCR